MLRPTQRLQDPPIKTQKFVDIDNTVAPLAKTVTFAQLEDHHCRWPMNKAGTRYCGARKTRGSLCDFHHDKGKQCATVG